MHEMLVAKMEEGSEGRGTRQGGLNAGRRCIDGLYIESKILHALPNRAIGYIHYTAY